MIFECIKEGFVLTNNNLQLVLVRVAAAIMNLFSFFIFLGIPVIAAIAYLGLDISGARDMFPSLLANPFDFVSRYLGLVILLSASFVFYLLFFSVVILYVLSGCVGVLSNAAVNVEYTFSISSFFREANQNFIRLMWVLSIVLIILSALLLVFLLIAGVVSAAVQALSGTGTTIEVFFSAFMLISAIIIGALVSFASIVFSVYSVVVSVVERTGAIDSIKKTAGFLMDKPEALLYCLLLFAGAVVLSLLSFALKIPFSMVPLIGPAMGIGVSLLSIVFKSYISIAVWASLIVYYVKATDHPVYCEI